MRVKLALKTSAILVFLAPISSKSGLAADCPTLSDVRSAYFENRREETEKDLQCLERRYPRDGDVLRFRSDLLWWGGNSRASREVAEKVIIEDIAADDLELRRWASRRTKRSRARARVSRFSAERQDGGEIDLGLATRFKERGEIEANYGRHERVFGGTPKLTDDRYGVSVVSVLSPGSYVETAAGYAPDADFSPKWYVRAEPQFAVGRAMELGAGFQYGDYQDSSSAKTLTLSGSYAFGELTRASARVYSTLYSGLKNSASVKLSHRLGRDLGVAAGLSGGRAVEGPGLIGSFQSYLVGAEVLLGAGTAIGVDGNFYRGSVRDEDRWGCQIIQRF